MNIGGGDALNVPQIDFAPTKGGHGMNNDVGRGMGMRHKLKAKLRTNNCGILSHF